MLSGSYGRFVTGLVAVGDPRTRVYASTENERKFANRESVFCRRPLNTFGGCFLNQSRSLVTRIERRVVFIVWWRDFV